MGILYRETDLSFCTYCTGFRYRFCCHVLRIICTFVIVIWLNEQCAFINMCCIFSNLETYYSRSTLTSAQTGRLDRGRTDLSQKTNRKYLCCLFCWWVQNQRHWSIVEFSAFAISMVLTIIGFRSCFPWSRVESL